MADNNPRLGDRVRVVYEGIVNAVDDINPDEIGLKGSGMFYGVDFVEIIERADDPEENPKTGDRVRVTYEGIVDDEGMIKMYDTAGDYLGRLWFGGNGASVDILERADQGELKPGVDTRRSNR